MYQAGSPHWHG